MMKLLPHALIVFFVMGITGPVARNPETHWLYMLVPVLSAYSLGFAMRAHAARRQEPESPTCAGCEEDEPLYGISPIISQRSEWTFFCEECHAKFEERWQNSEGPKQLAALHLFIAKNSDKYMPPPDQQGI